MSETKDAEWDLEAVYDEQIAPLMTHVIAICKEHRLPMFASFAYAYNKSEDETSFCTTHIPIEERPAPAFVECLRAVQRSPSVMAFTITTSPLERKP